jgi:mono/diheme cytochrome c family protein
MRHRLERRRTALALGVSVCVVLGGSNALAQAIQSKSGAAQSDRARGRVVYVQHCASCHGPDGQALVEAVANATNLTRPDRYKFGHSEVELFQSVKAGAGTGMPAFGGVLKDADIRNVAAYVASLWKSKPAARPQ